MCIKKIAVSLAILLFFVHSSAFAASTAGIIKVVNEKNETLFSKEVSFQEGETLYEATKKAFNVEESGGHIVTINGIRSIPHQNIHWAAFVNGNFIEVGLNEVMLDANDHVVWALKDWDYREILK